MKRGGDRVEMVLRLLLLIAGIAAVPLGILQGAATYHREEGIAPQEARDHEPVQAVVVADPPFVDVLPPDAIVQADVTWTDPDGTPARASVPVMATMRAHDRITLWVSPDGRLTGPPLERQPSLGHALWVGSLAGLTVPVVAWELLGLARVGLDTRRSRQWESEWLAVEPVWTSRKG